MYLYEQLFPLLVTHNTESLMYYDSTLCNLNKKKILRGFLNKIPKSTNLARMHIFQKALF